MTAPASGFQMKNTLLYYRKLYFTTENFTTWKVFFLQNLCSIYHSKINNFFISIDVLEYE